MSRGKPVLILRREHIDFIFRDGMERYPHEACGLMLGKIRGNFFEVRDVKKANNLSDNPIRFILDPKDFLKIQDEADRDGLDIIGVYHTHPDHPPIASQYDLESAVEGWFYLIMSIYSGEMRGMKGWILEDGGKKFVEAHVEISDFGGN